MEQLERAKRYLARMEKIYEGIFSSSHDRESYDDDVVSFFIHCYHVRDWIIHLNKLGITAKEVDLYINSHRCLMICADLANGSKHCKLTRSLRTERQPHISGKRRDTSGWLTGNGGGEVMTCKYTVLSNEEFLDALDLARDSILLWDKYTETLQEAYNKSRQQGPAAGTR